MAVQINSERLEFHSEIMQDKVHPMIVLNLQTFRSIEFRYCRFIEFVWNSAERGYRKDGGKFVMNQKTNESINILNPMLFCSVFSRNDLLKQLLLRVLTECAEDDTVISETIPSSEQTPEPMLIGDIYDRDGRLKCITGIRIMNEDEFLIGQEQFFASIHRRVVYDPELKEAKPELILIALNDGTGCDKNKSRMIRTIRNTCVETGEYLSDDFSGIILICSGTGDRFEHLPLVPFCDFAMGIHSDDPFITDIEQEMKAIRTDPEWIIEFRRCEDFRQLEKEKKAAYREGVSAGIQKGKIHSMYQKETDAAEVLCRTLAECGLEQSLIEQKVLRAYPFASQVIRNVMSDNENTLTSNTDMLDELFSFNQFSDMRRAAAGPDAQRNEFTE